MLDNYGYVADILISFLQQQLFRELASMLRLQVHCLIVQELLMWSKLILK